MPRWKHESPAAHRTRNGRNAAPGFHDSRERKPDDDAPRPRQIGEKVCRVVNPSGHLQYHPVRVFEPRPAYDMDITVVNYVRCDSRFRRWGTKPGEMDSL